MSGRKASTSLKGMMDEKTLNQLYRNLEFYIKQCKLSKRALSELAGIHYNHLCGMMKYRQDIRATTINRLCIALGISPGQLWDYDERKKALPAISDFPGEDQPSELDKKPDLF